LIDLQLSLESPLSTDQLSCEPYSKTRKSLTANEYFILAEVFTSEGVCGSIDRRLWQLQARRNGRCRCSVSRHSDGHY